MNKLIEIIGTTSKKQNVVITGLLVNLFTCLLIPISMKSGFFEDYKRQRGKITPGEGLYYLVLSPFLSECKTVSFNLKKPIYIALKSIPITLKTSFLPLFHHNIFRGFRNSILKMKKHYNKSIFTIMMIKKGTNFLLLGKIRRRRLVK